MASPPVPSMYIESWLPGPDRLLFYTLTYKASSPKAILLFVHGFADHVSRYGEVHFRFVTRGVTVFAYDLRGFGRTALDPSQAGAGISCGKISRALELEDVEWWVHYLAKEYPGLPLFLIGYSAVRRSLIDPVVEDD